MRRVLAALMLTTTAAVGPAQEVLAPPAEIAAVQKHRQRAQQLAGKDLTKALFLCDATATVDFSRKFEHDARQWLEPTRAFDNLFYVGSAFVGVWIVKTSEGLILIDAMGSTEDARDRLVPGLRKLGLDPAQIKYVLVTHGHWDHYGGAPYLAETFGARVGLSEADWQLMERLEPGSAARMDRTPPRKDLVISDGQKLTLGDTSLSLYITPGHTPGTLSVIVPAREDGKTYPLSLLGGTLFPTTLEPTQNNGGLLGYSRSVQRLAEVSRSAKAVGLLNTHVSVDGSLERLRTAAARKPGQPNPFVIGADAVRRHYALFDECLQAAIARTRASGA